MRKTNEQIEDFVDATQGFTADDIALIGTRESRPLGQEADEVLDVQRTSLPKIIEALEKDVSELSQKLGKTTDPDEIASIQSELTAKRATIDSEQINLTNIRREQNVRRVEEVQNLDLDDAFAMADNAYTDSWLYKAVTTPMKRILQGALPGATKAMTVKLAGDSGVLLKLNQFGIATPKSVYQYAVTRNGEWLKVYTSMLEKYGQHTKKRLPNNCCGCKPVKHGRFICQVSARNKRDVCSR